MPDSQCTHHSSYQSHHCGQSPAENIASIVGNLFGLASATIRGSSHLIRSVYGGIVWEDHVRHESTHGCCDCCSHTYTVECMPCVSSCCHCCR